MTISPEIVENRRKWIEALRSGNYTQVTGRLFGGTEGNKQYCCLGVAAEVCASEPWRYFVTGHPSESAAYEGMRAALGIPSNDVETDSPMGDYQYEFVWRNDSRKLSFDEIADYAVSVFGENLDRDLEVAA